MQEELGWYSPRTALHVACPMCETDVRTDMIASPRDGDEVVERHLRLLHSLRADMATAPITFVDREWIDPFDLPLTLARSTTPLDLRTLLGVGVLPPAFQLPIAFRMLGPPALSCFMRGVGVARVALSIAILHASAATRRETIRLRSISVELGGWLLNLARAAMLRVWIRTSPPTVMAVDIAQWFTLDPISLPVCPVGDRRVFSTSTLALHGGRLPERTWFK